MKRNQIKIMKPHKTIMEEIVSNANIYPLIIEMSIQSHKVISYQGSNLCNKRKRGSSKGKQEPKPLADDIK